MSRISSTHPQASRLACMSLAWLILATLCPAQVTSRLSSRFLARGEQALLEVSVAGAQPDALPRIPAVPGLEIRPASRGPQSRVLPGRRLEHVFEYLVASYQIGRQRIPAIEVSAGGTATRTEPLDFSVFNPDELQWSEAVSGSTRFRYASAFRVLNATPYEGETTAVEIKLYVPRDLFVEDWGIPDFERDGVTAWRFQPSAMRGQLNLLGLPHVAVAYPSTLTPTRTGTVGIGPANIRLMTTEVVMDGILRRVTREVYLKVPGLELESKPLPPGAPAGFENAVGDFSIKVASSLTEAQEGDPIPVEIVVSGSGNLDTLRPPKPMDTSGWKIYEATPEMRGDERRELSGSTIFRQFIRPLELKPAIPAYQLVFFDPQKNSYQTVQSAPIPIRMTPAPTAPGAGTAAPQAAAPPMERMTDILGLIEPAGVTLPGALRLPVWLGHAVAGLFALALILKALWMRVGHRFRKNPLDTSRQRELRTIEAMVKGADDAGFLMAAGRFIERWCGTDPPPEARAVLAQRDDQCFRPEKPTGRILDARQRREILAVLRKSLTACLCLLLTAALTHRAQAGPADDARAAYESAKFDEAIALWLKAAEFPQLSPDILYNIGNACYRAGSPGHAALYYRRALARDPSHQESRQNLRFIERKYGSITIHRPEFQYALARLPLAAWQGMLWAGAWLFVLGILIFPATRPAARVRLLAVAMLVIAPLLAASGALGWRWFPNDAEFAPLDRQAVIVGENVILHAEAARTSPEVIDAPPGSLCEIVRLSGRWAYIAFASKTRGWVPVESIEKIIPAAPPKPPQIRKSKASGKSA